jgi:hypothetical protein
VKEEGRVEREERRELEMEIGRNRKRGDRTDR